MAYKGRFYFIVYLLFALFLIVVWRMVDLTILKRPFLQAQGQARSLRVVSIPAFRGMIQDRNGQPLAVSSRVFAVWMGLDAEQLNESDLKKLSDLLSLSKQTVSKAYERAHSNAFVYLKRNISPKVAAKIRALNLPGVHLKEEFKRYYPEGESFAHVLGITDVDDKGLEGLELAYDNWLRGESGKKKVVKDRLGRIISEIGLIKAPNPGKNLVLSLDKRIQYLAYQELKKTVKKFGAESGSVVVLDSTNGEILAMVNMPSFNPNVRPKIRDGRYRNRAVTDLFEPGSVMKAFSIASALQSGKYSQHSLVDTSPSWMVINGNTIRDDHNYGKISVEEVLKRSSNVGVTKMVLSNPAMLLIEVLRNVGFIAITESSFPGESAGFLNQKTLSRPFVLATLGFGYGISATTLQLAKAYSVFASDGMSHPVSFLKNAKKRRAYQALKPKIAVSVRNMLEQVVEDNGTGRRARIDSYRVAGKTGTARIADKKGYDRRRHIASFVGMAPASAPKLVIAVTINEPKKISYYGGVVAAPLFAKIMSGSLSYLGILPDKRSSTA